MSDDDMLDLEEAAKIISTHWRISLPQARARLVEALQQGKLPSWEDDKPIPPEAWNIRN